MRPELFTRAQLLSAGVSSSMISRQYTRVLPQLYSVEEPTTFVRCCAVTLWQPEALLSHRTAAWLYGWMKEPRIVEATLPRSMKARTPRWLTVYRRALPGREATEVQGLAVVNRERTLVDCVAVMEPNESGPLVEERLTNDMDLDMLEAFIRSTPKLRGNERALRQLSSAALGFASEPERVLDRALITCGLRLKTNYRVGSYMCDFVDQVAQVRRQNFLVLSGWMVLRYSAFDVMRNPRPIAREIADEVRRRRKARS